MLVEPLRKALTSSYAFLPLVGPDEAAAIPAVIDELERGLVGSTEAQIDRMVTKLALLYPSARISDAEAGARLELYVELLCDIPFDILSGAFRTIAQTSKFFPTVAEIREAASGALADRKARLFALRQLALKHCREWKRSPDPIGDEEREEVARMMSELRQKLAANAPGVDAGRA